MLFPSLGVNEMVSPVPAVETILDERANHATLLVDAVEEPTDMTTLAESNPAKLRRVPGGFHILTLTQRGRVMTRSGAIRPDPTSSGATRRVHGLLTPYVRRSLAVHD
jgi:hypothetical protein